MSLLLTRDTRGDGCRTTRDASTRHSKTQEQQGQTHIHTHRQTREQLQALQAQPKRGHGSDSTSPGAHRRARLRHKLVSKESGKSAHTMITKDSRVSPQSFAVISCLCHTPSRHSCSAPAPSILIITLRLSSMQSVLACFVRICPNACVALGGRQPSHKPGHLSHPQGHTPGRRARGGEAVLWAGCWLQGGAVPLNVVNVVVLI